MIFWNPPMALSAEPHKPSLPSRPFGADNAWRTMFDGDPTRIVILDGQGSFVETNRAWRAVNGEDNAGTPWSESNYFDRLVRLGSAVSLRIAQGVSEVLDGVREEFVVDFACLESTDSRWTTVRAYPWMRDGRRWAIVRHEDTTALGNALEQSALLSAVLTGLEAPVIICDLAHRVVRWNAGAEALYGYTAQQARGVRLEHLISPHGTSEGLGLASLDGCGRSSVRVVHRRRDGRQMSVDLTVRLLPDRDGRPGFLAIAASGVVDDD